MSSQIADALPHAIDNVRSPVCVGLDPVWDKLPAESKAQSDPPHAIEHFSRGVLEAVAGIVPVVKPQSACFERYGSAGVAALERTIAAARSLGLYVLLDAKRGDIGISAEHYAASAVAAGAHAITVNGYLGPSSIEPYLKAGLAVFVLVRTSNPDSDAVQSPRLEDGRSVAELMADVVAQLGSSIGSCGLSSVGAVVGATKAADARALRARMPNQIFLIPGYGAQGGTAADIAPMVRQNAASPGARGILVTASRSIIYPESLPGESWKAAVRRASGKLAAEIAAIA